MTISEYQEKVAEEKRIQRQEAYNKLFWVKSRNKYYEKEKKKLLAILETDGSVRSQKAQVYQYTARNKYGKVETDIFFAYSKLDVYTYLISLGYDVYKIETSKFITTMYGDQGREEMEQIKEYIKGQDMPDYFLMFN